MMFSESFFTILITCALILTGVGAITMIALWIRDMIKGKVW
jgi:hypothetical protein